MALFNKLKLGEPWGEFSLNWTEVPTKVKAHQSSYESSGDAYGYEKIDEEDIMGDASYFFHRMMGKNNCPNCYLKIKKTDKICPSCKHPLDD